MSSRYDAAMFEGETIGNLIERLARLQAAGQWLGDLNPVQRAALAYLGRANRFSRKPSLVAEYLSATRGTVSQTLKVLIRKGYVTERSAPGDGRARQLALTDAGWAALRTEDSLQLAITRLEPHQVQDLEQGLIDVLNAALAERGGRSFGLCASCRHHQMRQDGRFCGLLDLPLDPPEAGQICFEHAA